MYLPQRFNVFVRATAHRHLDVPLDGPRVWHPCPWASQVRISLHLSSFKPRRGTAIKTDVLAKSIVRHRWSAEIHQNWALMYLLTLNVAPQSQSRRARRTRSRGRPSPVSQATMPHPAGRSSASDSQAAAQLSPSCLPGSPEDLVSTGHPAGIKPTHPPNVMSDGQTTPGPRGLLSLILVAPRQPRYVCTLVGPWSACFLLCVQIGIKGHGIGVCFIVRAALPGCPFCRWPVCFNCLRWSRSFSLFAAAMSRTTTSNRCHSRGVASKAERGAGGFQAPKTHRHVVASVPPVPRWCAVAYVARMRPTSQFLRFGPVAIAHTRCRCQVPVDVGRGRGRGFETSGDSELGGGLRGNHAGVFFFFRAERGRSRSVRNGVPLKRVPRARRVGAVNGKLPGAAVKPLLQRTGWAAGGDSDGAAVEGGEGLRGRDGAITCAGTGQHVC